MGTSKHALDSQPRHISFVPYSQRFSDAGFVDTSTGRNLTSRFIIVPTTSAPFAEGVTRFRITVAYVIFYATSRLLSRVRRYCGDDSHIPR